MDRKKRINITFLNASSSLLLQLCLVASNFIIPHLILSYFGSEVNGLVSSINQFLSYISLVEGGVTGVVMACLYKPLHDNDHNKISSIVKTTNNFYRKIAAVFAIYALILAIVYPLIFKVNFSYAYVFSLTIILSISLLIQYTLSLSIRTLLNADKKVFIVSFTQIIIALISILLAFLSVKVFPSIHLLKLLTGILFLIQPLVFNCFSKKFYKIDKAAKDDKKLLAQRWDGFAVNIAAFIHNCTDIVILTIFTDFQTVSIYSVYALVTSGLRSIIQSIARGITPTIGHDLAARDGKKLNKDFDTFEYLIFELIFILFSVAALLITPFVLIYTNGVTDTNYNQPLFGILLLISEACYLIREHHVSLAYSANKFKEITIPCFIEAGLNIIISLILVRQFGLIGVTIGTIVSMSYRSIYHVFFTHKIIGRSVKKFIKNLIIFIIASVVSIAICLLVPSVQNNMLSWLWHGLAYLAIISTIQLLVSFIFYKKELKLVSNIILRHKK